MSIPRTHLNRLCSQRLSAEHFLNISSSLLWKILYKIKDKTLVLLWGKKGRKKKKEKWKRKRKKKMKKEEKTIRRNWKYMWLWIPIKNSNKKNPTSDLWHFQYLKWTSFIAALTPSESSAWITCISVPFLLKCWLNVRGEQSRTWK